MASTTSSADTEVNVRSETPGRTLEKLGDGAPSVAARILIQDGSRYPKSESQHFQIDFSCVQ